MNKLILLGALTAICGIAVVVALTDTKGATRALALQGITEIRIAGYAFSECGSNSIWRTKFSGVDINGNPVSGAVCTGLSTSEIIFDN